MKKSLLFVCVAVLGLMPTMASAGQILTYLPKAPDQVVFNGTTVSGSNIPVQAFLLAGNSYGSDTVNATLSFSATAAGPAEEIFGFLFVQLVTNISLNITADAPVNGHSNLLSVTAGTGDFLGVQSSGFTLSATTNATINDGVTFTSDFLDVAGVNFLSFQILTGSPDLLSINSGVLSSFETTAGPGTFVTDAPEPASFALLGGGLLALAGLRRRKV